MKVLFRILVAVLIVSPFIMLSTWDVMTRKAKSQEPDWKSVLKYVPNRNHIEKQKGIFIRPHKDLTIEDVITQMGEPQKTEDFLVRENEEASDRPIVYTLYYYPNMVFVQHDWAANPKSIYAILVKAE